MILPQVVHSPLVSWNREGLSLKFFCFFPLLCLINCEINLEPGYGEAKTICLRLVKICWRNFWIARGSIWQSLCPLPFTCSVIKEQNKMCLGPLGIWEDCSKLCLFCNATHFYALRSNEWCEVQKTNPIEVWLSPAGSSLLDSAMHLAYLGFQCILNLLHFPCL